MDSSKVVLILRLSYFTLYVLLVYNREWELEHGVELSPHLVNTDVDLKFFPRAPKERDVMNRVS